MPFTALLAGGHRVEDQLLDNHLAFLSSHRGTVVRDGATIYVESDRPEFTYAILRKGAALEALPATTKTVQLFPSSEITPDDLTRAGFVPTTGLSYMLLGADAPRWRVRDDLSITRVRTPSEMDAFSQVQSRGFFETEESAAHWYPWLKAANDRNLTNPNQTFYVGSLSARPVGTTLSVFDGESTGIYAVATLAQHRRKGVSTTIMQEAIRDATARGSKVVLLQVKQDSYVEEFYDHLGFRRMFLTTMFRRE
jgi:GNAT superfamily N-acetyltransferase